MTEKKQVKTVKDKLATISESFTVNMYDNGYMLEINGRGYPDKDGDSEWACAKIVVPTVDDLVELIRETTTLPKDND